MSWPADPERFAISYQDMGPISTLGRHPAGRRPRPGGRDRARRRRAQAPDGRLQGRVPRASVRRVGAVVALGPGGRSACTPGGGRWLANGSADGLVEIEDRSAVPHRAQALSTTVPPDDGHRADREPGRSGRLHRRGSARWRSSRHRLAEGVTGQERKFGPVVAAVLAGHALVAAWTWRDIRHQPDQRIREVRGSGGRPARSTSSDRSGTG